LTEKEVIKVIESFFDVGKTKNFSLLQDIQLNDSIFSSFSDVPPYDLKDYSTTIALEELRFANISDYDYEIKNTKVTILENTAILTCKLMQKGILIDNQTFTGEHIIIHGRATFVLLKRKNWKIMHYHLSKIK
jgi:hypothetical protein